MTEKNTKITKETLVPIGLVISIIIAVFFMGGLSQQVNNNTASIEKIDSKLSDLPSRSEIDANFDRLEELIKSK